MRRNCDRRPSDTLRPSLGDAGVVEGEEQQTVPPSAELPDGFDEEAPWLIHARPSRESMHHPGIDEPPSLDDDDYENAVDAPRAMSFVAELRPSHQVKPGNKKSWMNRNRLSSGVTPDKLTPSRASGASHRSSLSSVCFGDVQAPALENGRASHASDLSLTWHEARSGEWREVPSVDSAVTSSSIRRDRPSAMSSDESEADSTTSKTSSFNLGRRSKDFVRPRLEAEHFGFRSESMPQPGTLGHGALLRSQSATSEPSHQHGPLSPTSPSTMRPRSDEDFDVPAPPPAGAEEPPDGDWWGTAMRVDLETYMAVRVMLVRNSSNDSPPTPQRSPAWQVALDAAARERMELKTHSDNRRWPDALHSLEYVLEHGSEDFEDRVRGWIDALEVARETDADGLRVLLRQFPMDLLLRHILADLLVVSGDLLGASRVLIAGVLSGAGPALAHPHRAPLLLSWDSQMDCGYAKAQQSVRFSRLALASAKAARLPANPGRMTQASGFSQWSQRSDGQGDRSKAICEGAQKALRHALEAQRLFQKEITAVQDLPPAQLQRSTHLQGWSMALRCGRLGACALLGEAAALLQRHEEAKDSLLLAVREAGHLMKDPMASPRLRRLLFEEHRRLAALHERASTASEIAAMKDERVQSKGQD